MGSDQSYVDAFVVEDRECLGWCVAGRDNVAGAARAGMDAVLYTVPGPVLSRLGLGASECRDEAAGAGAGGTEANRTDH